ncbi:hypothetical protein XELAEV_18030023mg [Xenopus laevis]|uniref:Chemokine interleukin-8-like domain-containing protein n=1 Tax=Xenopus laevis TaxID=8355 RepID=A0A974HI70_XENLA|nr:hypothetical protein XELAEV_18030023mg [Xenopus laevis]
MSSMKTMLSAVLLITFIVSVTCDFGKLVSCCNRVSSAKPKVALVDFLIQKEDLPCVEAILFITNEGKILCSRPNIPWVRQKMKEIIAKKNTTANVTEKNPPREEKTNNQVA